MEAAPWKSEDEMSNLYRERSLYLQRFCRLLSVIEMNGAKSRLSARRSDPFNAQERLSAAVDFQSVMVQTQMIPQKSVFCEWRPRCGQGHRYTHTEKYKHALRCKSTFRYPKEGLQKTFLSYSGSGLSGCLKRWHFYTVKVFQVFHSSPIFPLQSLEPKASPCSFKVTSLWNKFDYQGLLLWHFPKVKREKKAKEKGREGSLVAS